MDSGIRSEPLDPRAAPSVAGDGSVERLSRRDALLLEFERRFGFSALGALTIVSIVLVLVLVSLPRLRGFAASANEEEALGASRRVAQLLATLPEESDGLPHLASVTAPLLRELNDAEFFDEGRRMRRHGYLFEILRVPRPQRTGLGRVVHAAEPEPVVAVLAWPWDAGRTGAPAWVATVEGRVFVHPNRARTWSGPDSRSRFRSAWSWNGWQPFGAATEPDPTR